MEINSAIAECSLRKNAFTLRIALASMLRLSHNNERWSYGVRSCIVEA